MTIPFFRSRIRSLRRRIAQDRASKASRRLDTCGVAFAATGEQYNTLARRAARRLHEVMPNVEIDLFTDAMVDDPVFAQIHLLEKKSTHRPKIEALLRSRFDLTLMLDADIYTVVDVSDVFDLMDRYDIAGVHGVLRTRLMGYGNQRIPRSFTVVNSGVLVTRRSGRLDELLRDWSLALPTNVEARDQPHLRRLLWENKDIRLGNLPLEYNCINPALLRLWARDFGAPRLLHLRKYHRLADPGDPMTPLTLEEVLKKKDVQRVNWLVETDFELGGNPNLPRPDNI